MFIRGAPHVYVRAWALGCFCSHIRTETSRRVLTASVDNCAETNLAEFGGRCRQAMFGVWVLWKQHSAQAHT